MNTELLHIKREEDVLRALELLKAGKLVAIPTETVYGLAADAQNAKAVNQIFEAKQRPNTHPLILHIDSVESLNQWAVDIPEQAYTLAKYFWPGPLTMVLKKSDLVSKAVTGGLDTVAIRVPNNPTLQRIIKELKSGLVAPSANPHKKLSPTSAQHVMDGLQGKISAVLDGGPCMVGIESTIIDLTTKTPTILRKGPLSKEDIEAVLHVPVHAPDSHTKAVAGNMKQHYQPRTKSKLCTLQEIENLIKNNAENTKYGVLYYSSNATLEGYLEALKVSANKQEYAAQLYTSLHVLDNKNIDCILIETPPQSEQWADIWDRLQKATS